MRTQPSASHITARKHVPSSGFELTFRFFHNLKSERMVDVKKYTHHHKEFFFFSPNSKFGKVMITFMWLFLQDMEQNQNSVTCFQGWGGHSLTLKTSPSTKSESERLVLLFTGCSVSALVGFLHTNLEVGVSSRL